MKNITLKISIIAFLTFSFNSCSQLNDLENSHNESNIEENSDAHAIIHIATTKVWDADGQDVKIYRPSGSTTGDLLVLILHRTDADLPLKINGWKRVAECLKQNNTYQCVTAADCINWESNTNFCNTFEYEDENVAAHDLAQAIFYKTVSSNEPGSYTFNMNISSPSHPGWAILTALRGADTTNPVRDWANKGNDGSSDSIFPSVYGEKGDMLLLSQSFDDRIDQSNFGAPDRTVLFGYVANSDESGFLYGGSLSSSGETDIMKTKGIGGPSSKDALISLTIRPQ